MEFSNYLHVEDDLKAGQTDSSGNIKPLDTIAIEANATVVEEKEVDETDNTHLSLVLIKIRKGIGIKHKYCFGCKQLTSVNHKHLTTKMLKIQQETQGRGRK